MGYSIDNILYELKQEQYEIELLSMERDWEFSAESWSSLDDLGWDEFPDEEDLLEIDDESDAQPDYEADDDSSVDDDFVSESIEYVCFGKWLEHDGEQWVWEDDTDMWSEMSR
jgi:hypothetical protein